MRIFGGFVIFLTVSSALVLHAPAIEASDYADKADNIRKELLARKASHAALIKKSTVLNKEVSALRDNLVNTSSALRSSEESLLTTDTRLKSLRQKKMSYLQDLYRDQQAVGGLVSAVQKYSRTSMPYMLLQEKPIDTARASTVMKSILPDLQRQSSYLKSQLSEITKIEAAIADQLQIQTQQNKKLSQQQNDLAALLSERKKVYESTENERIAQEKEMDRLGKESRNIEELMANIKLKDKERWRKKLVGSAPSFPSRKLSPVSGAIQTAFGEKDALGAESKGVTFATRPGAGVVVPLAGTVKFAGPFQKYKQILIVEHGGGYHSLIAGLARIDTVVGATLLAGEPVGVAEGSGSPQIYYELRFNGKPVNPQKLLVAQRKQEKG